MIATYGNIAGGSGVYLNGDEQENGDKKIRTHDEAGDRALGARIKPTLYAIEFAIYDDDQG